MAIKFDEALTSIIKKSIIGKKYIAFGFFCTNPSSVISFIRDKKAAFVEERKTIPNKLTKIIHLYANE